MFNRLRGLLDSEVRAAGRTAKQSLEAHRPEVNAQEAWLRAKEASRIVFAGIYSESGVIHRPLPYQLVAVDRSTGAASLLPTEPGSPYWIRGRR